MTRVQKFAELEDFKVKGMQRKILKEAKKHKGESIFFGLMGHDCSFKIFDEEEKGVLVEKFLISVNVDSACISRSRLIKNNVDILKELFLNIENFYFEREILSGIGSICEDQWTLSEYKVIFISSLLALRDFLIKEQKISLEESSKIWKKYHPNGAVHIEVEHFFNNGEAFARIFDGNGNTLSEYLLIDGKKMGVARHYRENGFLYKVICYKNDEVLWEDDWDDCRDYFGDIEGKIWDNDLPTRIADCYGLGKELFFSEELDELMTREEIDKLEDEDDKKSFENVYERICYDFEGKDVGHILNVLIEKIEKARELCYKDQEIYNSITAEYTKDMGLDFFFIIEKMASLDMLNIDHIELVVESVLKNLYFNIFAPNKKSSQVFIEILVGLKILESISHSGKCNFIAYFR